MDHNSLKKEPATPPEPQMNKQTHLIPPEFFKRTQLLPPEFFEGNHFPHQESTIYEFKLSYGSQTKVFQKYLETLCGFLNTEGGYLIFGIKDQTNELIGLNQLSQKQIDQIICRFDQIICQSDISLRNTETNEIHSLLPGNIKTQQIVNKAGKKFLVVEARPTVHMKKSQSLSTPSTSTITDSPCSPALAEGDNDSGLTGKYKYQLVNGMVYHRLGASNYFEKTEKFIKQAVYEQQMKKLEKDYQEENKRNIDCFRNTLKQKELKLLEKEKELKELEENLMKAKEKLLKSEETQEVYQVHLSSALSHSSPESTVALYQPNSLLPILLSFIPCLK